jgi:hypothetical protein
MCTKTSMYLYRNSVNVGCNGCFLLFFCFFVVKKMQFHTPLHSRHTRIPKLMEAQSGSEINYQRGQIRGGNIIGGRGAMKDRAR